MLNYAIQTEKWSVLTQRRGCWWRCFQFEQQINDSKGLSDARTRFYNYKVIVKATILSFVVTIARSTVHNSAGLPKIS